MPSISTSKKGKIYIYISKKNLHFYSFLSLFSTFYNDIFPFFYIYNELHFLHFYNFFYHLFYILQAQKGPNLQSTATPPSPLLKSKKKKPQKQTGK